MKWVHNGQGSRQQGRPRFYAMNFSDWHIMAFCPQGNLMCITWTLGEMVVVDILPAHSWPAPPQIGSVLTPPHLILNLLGRYDQHLHRPTNRLPLGRSAIQTMCSQASPSLGPALCAEIKQLNWRYIALRFPPLLMQISHWPASWRVSWIFPPLQPLTRVTAHQLLISNIR